MGHPPAFESIIGRNVRAARMSRDLAQDELARRMRALGFQWSQQITASAELGRRRISVAELVGLALALNLAIADLMSARDVVSESAAPVAVTPATIMPAGVLDGLLAGRLPGRDWS